MQEVKSESVLCLASFEPLGFAESRAFVVWPWFLGVGPTITPVNDGIKQGGHQTARTHVLLPVTRCLHLI